MLRHESITEVIDTINNLPSSSMIRTQCLTLNATNNAITLASAKVKKYELLLALLHQEPSVVLHDPKNAYILVWDTYYHYDREAFDSIKVSTSTTLTKDQLWHCQKDIFNSYSVQDKLIHLLEDAQEILSFHLSRKAYLCEEV